MRFNKEVKQDKKVRDEFFEHQRLKKKSLLLNGTETAPTFKSDKHSTMSNDLKMFSVLQKTFNENKTEGEFLKWLIY